MEIIKFEDGQVVKPASVTIDGVEHEVTPAVYEGNTPLSSYNLNRMQEKIIEGLTVIKDMFPISTVLQICSDVIPENWLLCDGQAVSRTTYAKLFSVLGTKYGEGNGSTTFNLPNFKGKVVIGKDPNDTDFNTLGKTGGEKTHKLTVEELAKHNHSIGAHSHGLNNHTHTYSKSATATNSHTLTIEETPSHTHTISFDFGGSGSDRRTLGSTSTAENTKTNAVGGGKGHSHGITLTSTNSGASTGSTASSTAFNSENTGSNTAHNNLQPYITCNFIIKAN